MASHGESLWCFSQFAYLNSFSDKTSSLISKDSWTPKQDVQISAVSVQQFWFSCSQSPRVLLWMLNWKWEPDKHRAEGQWNPIINLSGKQKALPDHQAGSKSVVNGRLMCQRTPVTRSWGAEMLFNPLSSSLILVMWVDFRFFPVPSQ